MKQFPFPNQRESYYELERDITYERIPEKDREVICNKAWQAGVDNAIALSQQYFEQDIYKMIHNAHLELVRKYKDQIACGMRYFSEYVPGEHKIVIYKLSVEEFAKRNDLQYEEAEELILAHEFFHHLECTTIGRVSALYTVPNFVIGKFTFGKTSVRALSEIAAHGFARTYWEMKYGCRILSAME